MSNLAKEEITVKASLPPGPVQLPEPTSPVKDLSITELVQGELQEKPQTEGPPISPEERAKRKAYIVQALERGVINERMKVALPDNLYGCWVRRDPLEVDNMKRMGFRVDTEYASERSLHTDGTGAAMIGDVIHMVTEKWNKELIDEVKHERFMAMHSKKSRDKEEKDFAEQTRAETGGIIPTVAESKTREARKDDIRAAIDALASQTKPQSP